MKQVTHPAKRLSTSNVFNVTRSLEAEPEAEAAALEAAFPFPASEIESEFRLPLKIKCETLFPISLPLSMCTEILLIRIFAPFSWGLRPPGPPAAPPAPPTPLRLAVTHLLLFLSSSQDSQKVSVELSLRLPTMATRLETCNNEFEILRILLQKNQNKLNLKNHLLSTMKKILTKDNGLIIKGFISIDSQNKDPL